MQATASLGGWGDETTFGAAALLAVICCGVTAWRTHGRLRLAWSALALYAGLWGIGQMAGVSGARTTRGLTAPFPAWVDAVYFGATGFAATAALLLQSRGRLRLGWLRSLLDAGMIAAALTVIGWNTTVAQVIDVSRFTDLQKGALLAHPIGDAAVITLLVTAAIRPMRLTHASVRAPVLLLTLAFALLFAADSIFSYRLARGDSVSGLLLDLLWTAGLVLVAASALGRRLAPGPTREARRREGRVGAGYLLPALTIAVSCAVAGWHFASTGGLDVVDFSSLVALVVLASARQALAAVDNRRMADSMAEQARRDPLTGVLNRREFTALLRDALEEPGAAVAVLFVDIDGFKAINDTHGHQAGDALLTTVSRRIVTSVRPSDVVARLGGDEFGVLVVGHDIVSTAERTAERIRLHLREAIVLGRVELRISASVGVACAESGDATPELLQQRADIAMYRAKGRGRDRVESFDADVHRSLVGRLRVESEIALALERQEFVLHYQPIVELATLRVAGVEALVRWKHPERGLLGADDFVPVAEETGFVVDLGRWVLYEACRQASSWQAGGTPPFFVSVNVSARQVREPGLREAVVDALQMHGLRPESLVLEVTESAVMEDSAAAHRALAELREGAVRIAIDDFGTGYSSLSKLAQPQVDILKTDGLFVRAGPGTPAALISSAILALGRALGLELIAEGIEDEVQAGHTLRTGYRLGQGYHLARPATAERLLALGLLPATPAAPRPQGVQRS
jgi:diguanylate cyclase